MFKLCCLLAFVQHREISFLSLGRRNIADGFQQPSVVEPAHPFQRGKFDRFKTAPRPTRVNNLGFVKPVDRFGERWLGLSEQLRGYS